MNDLFADCIRIEITRAVRKLYIKAYANSEEVADLLAEVHDEVAAEFD